MSELETFSRYLNDLTRQGKLENVIISFQESAHRFSKEEIAGNYYLVYNILNAYRNTERPREGVSFFDEYNVQFSDKHRIILSTYGWMVYDILKNELKEPTNDSAIYLNKAIPVLLLLDFTNEIESSLFKFLFSSILRLEKKRNTNNLEIVFQVLRGIKFRKNTYAQEAIKSNDFIVPFILDIFRKNQKFKWADAFLDFLKIGPIENHPAFLNAYGWLLYSKLKSELYENEEDSLDTAEEERNSFIFDLETEESLISGTIDNTIDRVKTLLGSFDRKNKYSPFSKLFQLVLKAEKKKSNPNWESILTYINSIDPDSLSLDCEKMEFEKNGKLKTIELASDKELWYSNKVNALFKLGDYQQCIETIEKAQQVIPKFHYGYDVWFLWRIGQCKKEFGKVEDAIKDIIQVLQKKKEWFVQKELAELYYKKGDIGNALSFAIESALNYGDKEKKDGLLFLLGEILQFKKEYELAYKHFMLAKLIRETQQWRIPQKYTDNLAQDIFTSYSSISFSLNLLYKELSAYWKSMTNNGKKDYPKQGIIGNREKKRGTIKTLNIEKGFGFIQGEDKVNYYFKIKHVISPTQNLKIHKKVVFEFCPPVGDVKGYAMNVKVENV